MKNSFKLKTLFSIFSVAPFIVLVIMLFIFGGLTVSRNTVSGELEASQYLIKPIQKIIDSNYNYAGDTEGVLMLMDSYSNIIYPAYNRTVIDQQVHQKNMLNSFLINDIASISIFSYKYKGEDYFVFFDDMHMPTIMKSQLRMVVGLLILVISIIGLIFNQMIKVIINSSITSLVEASEMIANGNLDEKITLKYNNELVFIADGIDKMRIELKEKRNIEQRFFMSVTHDLKTPLTSINGYLEAIADGIISDSDEVISSVKLMQKKSDLLQNRISELLDYSRNRTAGWRDQWSSVNISEWINGMSSMFESDAGLYNRKYDTRIYGLEDLHVFCNERLLTRALENIFDNATRYTNDGDSVIFSAFLEKKRKGNVFKLIIEDSGSGIDEEDLDKIFDLFYRNDRGRNSRGMGIGLASVQTIVKDHGGEIQCDKSEMGGARFTITLDC